MPISMAQPGTSSERNANDSANATKKPTRGAQLAWSRVKSTVFAAAPAKSAMISVKVKKVDPANAVPFRAGVREEAYVRSRFN
jgi:hypothetical protein